MSKLSEGNMILSFATMEDKRRIYDMLVSEDIVHNMFNEAHPAPSWEEFDEDEDNSYFTGNPSETGSYMMILVDGALAGTISYSCGYDKLKYAEMDIWLAGKAFMGRGIGSRALLLLREYVYKTYHIDTFLIRPWVKNESAIRTYKKCGFEIDNTLNIADYYDDESLEEYGDGDYGVEETVNMIMRY